MSTNVLSIRLPEDVKSRLDALSKATGRPVAYYVRAAVVEHLNELEWVYDAAARAEEVRAGIRETRSLDDVAGHLGFDPDELRAEARADDDAG